MVTIVNAEVTKGKRLYGETAGGVGYMMPAKKTERFLKNLPDGKIPETLYCIVDSVKYNELSTEKDADGNYLPKTDKEGNVITFSRNDILAAFTTKEKCIEVYNDDALMQIEADAQLQQAATAAGLSTESLAELRAMSV